MDTTLETEAAHPRAARTGTNDAAASPGPFRHEALLYAGDGEFVERCAAFLRDGLNQGEPVLVVVVARKIGMLREALNGDASAILFADMAEVGRNPGRIIAAWQEFVVRYGAEGQPVRGIGEPIWAGRTSDELIESQRHEALLNLAFAGSNAWMLCPYDTIALDAAVIAEARRSHPIVSSDGVAARSADYHAHVPGALSSTLPPPSMAPFEIPVVPYGLDAVRAFVLEQAIAFDMSFDRATDFVLSVNEIATNSLRHAGGEGALRLWFERERIVCEVADGGRIDQPLVGRRRPSTPQESGLGLWLVNQLCDLVQVRSFPGGGSVVRVQMSR